MVSLSRDHVRYVALAAMVVNHAAHTFLPRSSPLFWALFDIGFITAPVMCWFLVQGFHMTRDRRKYAMRIFVAAVVSQPFYMAWFMSCGWTNHELNMLFTLLACFGILAVRDSGMGGSAKLVLQVLLAAATSLATWPFLPVAMVVLFDESWRRCKDGAARRKCDFAVFAFAAVAVLLIHRFGISAFWHSIEREHFWMSVPASLSVLLAGAMCVMSSQTGPAKRRTRFSKYWSYAIYPVHLALISLAAYLVWAFVLHHVA